MKTPERSTTAPLTSVAPPRCRAAVALLALAALGASGCYASWDIGPKELSRLAGYSAPAKVELVSTTGKPFAYGPEHSLVFHEGEPVVRQALCVVPDRAGRVPCVVQEGGVRQAQFDDIRIDGDVLQGVERRNGQRYALDLRNVKRVEAKRFSPGGTAGLVVGVTLGVLTVATVVTGAVLFSRSPGWGNWDFGGGDRAYPPPHPRPR
jgi:hypothetical protein